MRIDFKESIWYQMDIPDEFNDDISRMVKDGTFITPTDVIQYLETQGINTHGEYNIQSTDPLPPTKGDASIELLNEQGDIIWSNDC